MTEPTYTLTQDHIDDVVELLVTSLHHVLVGDVKLKADTNVMIQLLRSLTPNSGEPVAHGFLCNGKITDALVVGHNDDPEYNIPLFTHPAPSTKPAYSYAGVTMWLGDKSITQHIPRCQIDTERVSGMSLSNTAKHCLDMLAAPQQGETE